MRLPTHINAFTYPYQCVYLPISIIIFTITYKCTINIITYKCVYLTKIMTKDLVVKTNRLNMAIHNLSLTEIRIIQLAIVDARGTGTGLSADKPLRIQATRYAEVFGTTRQTAYEVILEAETNLFERRFTFIDERDGKSVKSRWVSQVKYLDDEGAIEVIFTPAVVEEIKRINGSDTPFTEYLLQQISDLSSVYATRLYELLIQWKHLWKTPVFELSRFREQLGLGINEYQLMSNFKKGILDLALTQINERTDITVSYEQHKRGRVITGFSFKFKQKPKAVEPEATPKQDIYALLTDEFVAQHAQVGESWEQARTRLRKEAATGKFSLSLTP
jgi:plasmid replication initiation protein